MKLKTKTQLGQLGLEQTLGTTELPGQSGAKTVNTHLPNLETEVQQTASNVGVLLLTVLNATAEDSGPFWCVADNGLGNVEVRNATYLLVRRKFLPPIAIYVYL